MLSQLALLDPRSSEKPSVPAPRDEDQAALRFVGLFPEAALCTIVGIDGSFSRRLGSQLAVGSDGTVAGSLADACLEREFVAQTRMARAEGIPRLLRYGRGSPFMDFRLPCGSGLDVLVDPRPNYGAVQLAIRELDRRRPGSLPLPPTRRDLLVARQYQPALRVLACGAGAEIAAFKHLANATNVATVAFGPDTGLSSRVPPRSMLVDRWTAIALLFHDHDWERSLLGWALRSAAFYVGAIGGAQARADRNAWLSTLNLPESTIARLQSPMGLIRNARDPGVLALSVLSEIVGEFERLRLVPLL